MTKISSVSAAPHAPNAGSTMAPLAEPERRDFWEICEDRYQVLLDRSRSGMSRSAIPPWPTAFSTGTCTTPTASR